MSFMNKTIKLSLLFICGFLAGICLEILFVQTGRIKDYIYQINDVPVKDFVRGYVNVTCLIVLKHDHFKYVNSSKRSWLKHCDSYVLVKITKETKTKPDLKPNISSSDPHKFKKIIKNFTICADNDDVVEISSKSAWAGLCKAFHFLKIQNLQWLIIVPDSSMIFIQNLKYFVREIDNTEPHYFGYALEHYQANYNIMSAGVLLSRGAVLKLLKKFNSTESCDNSGKHWNNEDLYLGMHLKEFNIFPKDTRDEHGRGRFHGYNINHILWPGKLFMKSNYHRKALFPVSKGFNCCSPYIITTDVSDPDSMYKLYFLMYKLKTNHRSMPTKNTVSTTEGTYWKEFLREEGYREDEIENISGEEYYKIWEKKFPPSKMYEDMQNLVRNNKWTID